MIGLGLFVFGLIMAIIFSIAEDAREMNPVFLHTTQSIAAVLATNLGAVLGFAVMDPQSAFRVAAQWNPMRWFGKLSTAHIQMLATIIYLLGMLSAFIVWVILGFNEEPAEIVPLIPALGSSLLGVIVGSMVVVLGKPE